MEGGDDFFKKRLEKDLAELKKMIDSHFGKIYVGKYKFLILIGSMGFYWVYLCRVTFLDFLVFTATYAHKTPN